MPDEMSPGNLSTQRYREAGTEQAMPMVRQCATELGTGHGPLNRVAGQNSIAAESSRDPGRRREIDESLKPGTTSAGAPPPD